MGTTYTFARFLLAAAVAMPWSTQLRAAPDDCDPKVVFAPRESESAASSFFGRLFGTGDKPQPFAGAVMDEPDPECQLAGGQARPFVNEPRLPERHRAMN